MIQYEKIYYFFMIFNITQVVKRDTSPIVVLHKNNRDTLE